jgi:homospermidine synthase
VDVDGKRQALANEDDDAQAWLFAAPSAGIRVVHVSLRPAQRAAHIAP